MEREDGIVIRVGDQQGWKMAGVFRFMEGLQGMVRLSHQGWKGVCKGVEANTLKDPSIQSMRKVFVCDV